jgi:hypothetical protein
MDLQHLITTAVYSLFGGLTFILINDGLKYFLGSTTIANPWKQVPSRQFENLVKLLKKLLSAKSWDNLSNAEKHERTTRYLINQLA